MVDPVLRSAAKNKADVPLQWRHACNCRTENRLLAKERDIENEQDGMPAQVKDVTEQRTVAEWMGIRAGSRIRKVIAAVTSVDQLSGDGEIQCFCHTAGNHDHTWRMVLCW